MTSVGDDAVTALPPSTLPATESSLVTEVPPPPPPPSEDEVPPPQTMQRPEAPDEEDASGATLRCLEDVASLRKSSLGQASGHSPRASGVASHTSRQSEQQQGSPLAGPTPVSALRAKFEPTKRTSGSAEVAAGSLGLTNTAGETAAPPPPPTVFSPEQLERAVHYFCSLHDFHADVACFGSAAGSFGRSGSGGSGGSINASSNGGSVFTPRLPIHPPQIVSDINEADRSIFKALTAKLDRCIQLLAIPVKAEWRYQKRSIADRFPHGLFDGLLDALCFVIATRGIWNLGLNDPPSITGKLDYICVQTSELQRKHIARSRAAISSTSSAASPRRGLVDSALNALNESSRNCAGVAGANKQTHSATASLKVSPAQLCEALGRVSASLLETVHCALDVATSRLFHGAQLTADPMIALLESTLITAGGKAPAFGTPQAPPDDVQSFLTTVTTLTTGSDLCMRLFHSSFEFKSLLHCLRSIRAGIEEVARLRSFEWNSFLLKTQQQQQFAPLPLPGANADGIDGDSRCEVAKGDGLDSSATSGERQALENPCDTPGSVVQRGIIGKNASASGTTLPSNGSAAAAEIEALLKTQLLNLSSCFRSVYRFIGSLFGGVYEAPEVQAELSDASMLSSYVSMVTFLFFNDFARLTRCLDPYLVRVRRRIVGQSSAVNRPADLSSAPLTSSSASASCSNRPSIAPSNNDELTGSSQEEGSAESQNSEECKQVGAESGSEGLTTVTPQNSTVQQQARAQQPPVTASSSLSQLLSSPQDICLSRPLETEALQTLLLPTQRSTATNATPATRASSSVAQLSGLTAPLRAPNDRVLRVLCWLAWEGGLAGVLEQARAMQGAPAPKATMASPSKPRRPSHGAQVPAGAHQVEEAIVNAITLGARTVKDRFSPALRLFQIPVQSEGSQQPQQLLSTSAGTLPMWSGRGNDLLDFAARVVDALTVRFVGEVDVSVTARKMAADDNPSIVTPRWRNYLLVELARALSNAGKGTSVPESKVPFGLPKLLGEFCHQTLFYGSPLLNRPDHPLHRAGTSPLSEHQLGAGGIDTRLGGRFGVDGAAADLARVTAMCARLSGQARDADARTTGVQRSAEVALQGTKSLSLAVDQMSQRVESQQRDFDHTRSIVDRLSEQGRNQMNSSERHESRLARIENELKSYKKQGTDETSKIWVELKACTRSLKTLSDKLESEAAAATEAGPTAADLKTTIEQLHEQMMKKLEETSSTMAGLELRVQSSEAEAARWVSRTSKEFAKLKEETQLQSEQAEASMRCALERQIEQHNIALQECRVHLEETMKESLQGVADTVVSRSRNELSSFLNAHLAQTVSSQVAFHLEKALQQHAARNKRSGRFLSWGGGGSATPTAGRSGAGISGGNSLEPAPLIFTTGSAGPTLLPSSSAKGRGLVGGLSRPKSASGSYIGNSEEPKRKDEISSVADSSAVLDEDALSTVPENGVGGSSSYIGDTSLLDLADPSEIILAIPRLSTSSSVSNMLTPRTSQVTVIKTPRMMIDEVPPPTPTHSARELED